LPPLHPLHSQLHKQRGRLCLQCQQRVDCTSGSRLSSADYRTPSAVNMHHRRQLMFCGQLLNVSLWGPWHPQGSRRTAAAAAAASSSVVGQINGTVGWERQLEGSSSSRQQQAAAAGSSSSKHVTVP
jgi:hypothetical protein